MLLPGEETEIALTVHIDNRIASSLNLGPRDMSGTLILHTVLGKDHFIAISGEYRRSHYPLYGTADHAECRGIVPSCFGNKLTTLTRLPGPIRTLTSSKELRAENHPLNAPREVMRLVNWLMGSTTLPKDLFLTSPEASMVETIREVSHPRLSPEVEFQCHWETPFCSASIQAKNSLGLPEMRVRHPHTRSREPSWSFWIL